MAGLTRYTFIGAYCSSFTKDTTESFKKFYHKNFFLFKGDIAQPQKLGYTVT